MSFRPALLLFVFLNQVVVSAFVLTTRRTRAQKHLSSFQAVSKTLSHRTHGGGTGSSAHYYSSNNQEDLFSAVHRKEYEMKQVNQRHKAVSDPVRMAMGYIEATEPPLKLARALRRVYEDPHNTANPNATKMEDEKEERAEKMESLGFKEAGMRRGSFVVDIKRKSALSHPEAGVYANFDDSAMVAEAMIKLGADVVFVNVDYPGYGGDISELRSTVSAVRRISKTAAVVMKDIVVDEIQLGLAKEAGADGIVLIAAVLGPQLENFVNLATIIGLETIVECHTKNEVEYAISCMAQNIMVNNFDRVTRQYYPQQAIQLAGLFPGSGGPIITLACGGISDTKQMKKLLAVGYDAVVVGREIMGSTRAPEFIRAVRDRTMLPAEFSQWGLDDYEFDVDGNLIEEPEEIIPSPDDDNVYQ